MGMIDREKVIKGLEWIVTLFSNYERHAMGDEEMQSLNDAIALLKAQEPIPVYEDKINKCECGEEVNRYWHPKFCGFCGKELLWY